MLQSGRMPRLPYSVLQFVTGIFFKVSPFELLEFSSLNIFMCTLQTVAATLLLCKVVCPIPRGKAEQKGIRYRRYMALGQS